MGRDELKPCPFCGGVATLAEDAEHSTAYWVRCRNDGCFAEPQVWNTTKAGATTSWNRRAGE